MLAAMRNITTWGEWHFCSGRRSKRRDATDLNSLKWAVPTLTILDSLRSKNTGVPLARNCTTGNTREDQGRMRTALRKASSGDWCPLLRSPSSGLWVDSCTSTSARATPTANPFDMTRKTIVRAMCALVLGCILVAGLWPFHAPKNDVSWMSNGNGLLFGEYGSILSSGSLKALESSEVCSVEIWLKPGLEHSGTILAFYRPETVVLPFELWQSGADLGIRRSTIDHSQHIETSRIYVGDLFRDSKLVFITISSGPAGTAVYEDGILSRKVPEFGFSAQDLAGQFTVGKNPRGG